MPWHYEGWPQLLHHGSQHYEGRGWAACVASAFPWGHLLLVSRRALPYFPRRARRCGCGIHRPETDSLDVLSGNIVEIGALVGGSRAAFSTVVNPGRRGTREADAVHGILPEELEEGPSFVEAFQRLDQFLRFASVSALVFDSDSDDDEAAPPAAMRPDLEIALVGHNALRFDYPFLLAECLRAGLGSSAMSPWMFVDTMDLLRATDSGECFKLQCAFARVCRGPSCLRAHRALDNCIALEAVGDCVSARMGVIPLNLLRCFARRMDEPATIAQLAALMAD